MKWYLLHPAFVHFPIALLLSGLVPLLLDRRRGRPELAFAASWLLWAGTAAAWIAVGLGLLAEDLAPHVPAAWEALADHKALGLWTASSFTALSLWRWRWRQKAPHLFIAAWLGAAGLLAATANEGGEVVYEHGMGVGAANR